MPKEGSFIELYRVTIVFKFFLCGGIYPLLTLKRKKKEKDKRRGRKQETFILPHSKCFPREIKEKLAQPFMGQIRNTILHLKTQHSSNVLSI